MKSIHFFWRSTYLVILPQYQNASSIWPKCTVCLSLGPRWGSESAPPSLGGRGGGKPKSGNKTIITAQIVNWLIVKGYFVPTEDKDDQPETMHNILCYTITM